MQDDEPEASSKTDARLPRKPRRRFGLSDHALLRYIERGSRIPLDMHWLSLHRRRHADGIFEDPTDWEILDHIERGVSLERLRRKFVTGLQTSRLLYRTPKADFMAIGGRLVAVVNRADNKALTVIDSEMAKASLPISSLKKNGVLTEEPAPALSEEERLASSGFRYAIGRPGFTSAEIVDELKRIAPEIRAVALGASGEVVVIVRLRASLEAVRSSDAFTAAPYTASQDEFVKLKPVAEATLQSSDAVAPTDG
jgi:hypothetical protein